MCKTYITYIYNISYQDLHPVENFAYIGWYNEELTDLGKLKRQTDINVDKLLMLNFRCFNC